MILTTIAIWMGYALMFSAGLCLCGLFFFVSYLVWDTNLKRLLGWNNHETRKDIMYFIKHKEEIIKIIKDKKNGNIKNNN